MIMVKDPFGEDPMDYDEKDEAARIGERIRKIRKEKGISTSELGEKVGLSADRIRKYENGTRKPKNDMLKAIASVLGVSTLALTDPVSRNYIGAMYAFFEMEEYYNAKIEKAPENHTPCMSVSVDFRDGLYKHMKKWYEVYTETQRKLEIAESEDEKKNIISEYNNWKWTYPNAICEHDEKSMMKLRLKEKIEELQDMYDALDDTEE